MSLLLLDSQGTGTPPEGRRIDLTANITTVKAFQADMDEAPVLNLTANIATVKLLEADLDDNPILDLTANITTVKQFTSNLT